MRRIAGAKSLAGYVRNLIILSTASFIVLNTSAVAQDVLPRVDSNNLLYVPFKGSPELGPVFAEINGIRQSLPARIVGSNYVVVVPSDLPGTRHDLRLIVGGPTESEELGWWLFETVGQTSLAFGSVLSEFGVRRSESATQGFAEGVVRLEFNRGNGQQSGRLVFSRSEDPSGTGDNEISVEDIFLEARFPMFGQDGYARIGNSDVGTNTLLHDEASRRGLSFGLDSANGQRRLTAFYLSPELELGLDNVLGLSDRDSRIAGVSASFQSPKLNTLQFDITAHQGRTRTLPDSTTGEVSGAAFALGLPFASGRGDLGFGIAKTNWSTDNSTTANAAMARELSLAWLLSEEDAYQRNELTVVYQQIEDGFFSPLNPDLITGEERVSVTLDSISPAWQWALSYELAETNYRGSPTAPIDKLSSASFYLLHDPGDFTGGALNGTTFYLNAGLDRQERLETPAGAAAAQDNQFSYLSFGMNKDQQNSSWGLRLTFDDLDFENGTAQDEQKLFADARLSVSPNANFSAEISARAGARETGGTRYLEAEAGIAFVMKSSDGLWQTALEGMYLSSEDPSVDNGRSATVSTARSIGSRSKLVGEVSWGSGQYAPEGSIDEGVTVGLFVRSDFGFSTK